MGPQAPSTAEGVLVVLGIAQSSEGFETGLFYLGFLNSMPIGTWHLGCEDNALRLHGGISHHRAGHPSYFTLDYEVSSSSR